MTLHRTLLVAAALAFTAPAFASITDFQPAPGTSGSFDATSARGSSSPLRGNFADDWVISFDGSDIVTFSVDNHFNTRTGSGALVYVATLTGPGASAVALDGSVDTVNGIFHFGKTFTGLSGTYTLSVTGNNPLNGDYRLGVTAAPVPEPATAAMLLAGLGLAGAAARRRRC